MDWSTCLSAKITTAFCLEGVGSSEEVFGMELGKNKIFDELMNWIQNCTCCGKSFKMRRC